MDFMGNRSEALGEDSDETNNNNNAERGDPNSGADVVAVEKEHMFDKVVTPSDVGKLNRLVIPKQHAEKYFPLDASTNEKGLLLNFEDRNGKPWRFRYSYWNSSQSYVMTKGWSRFVKEKKLDAGDIVSFHRGVGEVGKDRLYIDWRRRPDAPAHHHHHHLPSSSMSGFGNNFFISPLPRATIHHSIPWSPLLLRPPPTTQQFHHPLNNNVNLYPYQGGGGYSGGGGSSSYNPGNINSVIYLRPAPPPLHGIGVGGGGVGGGGAEEQIVFESVPVVHGKAAAKRLRLFGVNMDCPISDDQRDECSSSSAIAVTDSQLSSSIPASSNPHLQLRLYSGSSPSMEANFLDKGKAPSSSSSLDLDM